ncbi:MAG: hypothetical protein KDG55_15695 [Rhodocyclaceae bacterium]|nr:hypothetical protein [Rhodocyclaceae bacterium]
MGRNVRHLLLTILIALPCGGAFAQLALVTGANSNISEISRAQAERLFLGRATTLGDNSPVTLIDLPPGQIRDEFYLRLTGKNPVQTRANWSRQVFTGRALPPRQADSAEQVRAWLIEDPNAIGYLPASAVAADLRRLLKIDD